jgi:beta-carotene 15,15'-dioxygenase
MPATAMRRRQRRQQHDGARDRMKTLSARVTASSLPPEPLLRRGQTAALIFCLILALATAGSGGERWEVGAAIAILVFGLPHGAYDLQLLMPRAAVGHAAPRFSWALLAAYLGLAALATLAWAVAPATALFIFLCMAGVHFGEDWDMLDPGLLRTTVGFGPLIVVAISSPAEVAAIFGGLADRATADLLVGLCIMVAPVVLLVTAVSMLVAWQRGHRYWCAAYLTALIIAAVALPVFGFAAYFVLFHSALHLAQTRSLLPRWRVQQFGLHGVALSLCAVMLLWLVIDWLPAGAAQQSALAIFVFQLLAIVTVPHLLLTHRWIAIPART